METKVKRAMAASRRSQFKIFPCLHDSQEKEKYDCSFEYDKDEWLESKHEIGMYLTTKYLKIFKAKPTIFYDCLDHFILGGVSDADNTKIDAIPSTEEIHSIVKSMHPIQALGPDGMPAFFFQKYWRTVGNKVTTMIQNAFTSVIF